MAVVRSFKDVAPILDEQVFLAETAAVIGDVVIGDRSSVWYSSGVVVFGEATCFIFASDPKRRSRTARCFTLPAGATRPSLATASLWGTRPSCTGARVHVGDECIIGMGSTLLDRAVIGAHCIVGAGALVTPGTEIPEGHLAVGVPARVKRALTDEELAWIKSSAAGYVDLASRYLAAAQPNG